MVVDFVHGRLEAGLVATYWPSSEKTNNQGSDTDVKCVYGVSIRHPFRSGR